MSRMCLPSEVEVLEDLVIRRSRASSSMCRENGRSISDMLLTRGLMV
uniref:Uncharacterized protein n=1 Tax=Zea mays TaxID=4577 RepID=B6T7Y2_MAIZE|nr:hypothetical protein [Zea mays]